ncbi:MULTISPECIES: pirin family protein [Streptomyces]|uniref:Pirin family protein n=1 Tax=Streptomyces lycii TaxID=2654337 RepID=A0ABQ7FH10_9ACTN|nr:MULTISPECIES: pirin family protein [Streptomyces]KAF4406939.1 pirin family protein [Streptomyces lycii]PGH47349.1 MarR family transcriptional regulator [Streptomyces sp. Ru87]
MSGPVSTVDAPASRADTGHPSAPCVEVGDSREARIGGLRVRRALPRRGRRTVGAWCFADHMGPADITGNSGLDIGPHPHIGLQTVTWLTDGQALHLDSLGSEQVIKPGQLNLMTAGNAVSHAEVDTGHYRGVLEGIQLWVALPEATRHGPAAFEHHAELPRGELDGAVATVLMGEFGGLTSPARHDTPLMGAELALHRSTTVPLRTGFEYAVVVLEGEIAVHGEPLRPGRLGYLGRGRDELRIDVREPTRALLIGGEPFEEPIVMWWNFVGGSHDAVKQAREDWVAGRRFGRVEGYNGDPLPAPALPRLPGTPHGRPA